MRTDNSVKNSIVSVITLIITMLIGFVAQAVFLKVLGTEYLGVNGLFTNIVSMLAMIELGIGPAIVYNLYKPITDNDKEKIKSLLLFYKKSYRTIALVIALVGICILPFIRSIVGQVNLDCSVYFVFILFILDAVCSYLLTYKRSILYANQENYIVNLVHLLYVIILNILQIVILIYTKNYILYLLLKIVMRLIENICITIIVNRKYSYLNEKNVVVLDKDIVKDIMRKVKGLIFHKIGGFVVMGTDNILISTFIGISTVGIYSNYLLIINAVNMLFSQIFTSITASVGNLLVTENKEKIFDIYKKTNFLNFFIAVFSSTGLFCLLQGFITLWVGEQYLFNTNIVIAVVINFYFNMMRKAISTFKEAAGIYYEDRFVPLVESLINIVASIVFLKIFGLVGVFIGTITSTMILFLYSFPKYAYKKLFNKKISEYIKELIFKFIVAAIICAITYGITKFNSISNAYLSFVLNCCICLIIPNAIMLLLYRDSDEYKYFKNIISNIACGILKGKQKNT